MKRSLSNINEDKHECLHVDGKALHVETSNDGRVFCAYCHIQLEESQVHTKWKGLFRGERWKDRK